MFRYLTLVLVSFGVSGCAETHLASYGFKQVFGNEAPYSAPAVTGKRKIGKPYDIMGKTYYPLSSSEGYRRKGIASWYGDDFHGKKTANGEKYNMHDMTAAHPTLPLPTYVRVTHLENGKSIIVRVNDRGPFLRGRIIDLSYKAAKKLDMAEQGTAPVLLEALPTDGSVLKNRTRVAHIENNVTNTPRPHMPAYTYAPTQQSYSLTRKIEQPNIVEEPLVQVDEIALGHTRYYVQTGAFSYQENALAQKKQLEMHYQDVHIFAFKKQGRMFHRVRIGPLKDVASADNILQAVISSNWPQAQIVLD